MRLAVADTGTGISSDNLEKVMEPFFTTKELGKGSGLGLSMVYGFAKQSNGAFRLQSKVDTGTTAELWLPRASQSAAPEEPAAPEPSAVPLRPLRILLVDDHAEVRSTTAAVLQDGGHEVFEADNGAEALALLKTRDCDFDLLITDYAMPHLSGTDLLREARRALPGNAGAADHRLCGDGNYFRSSARRRDAAETIHAGGLRSCDWPRLWRGNRGFLTTVP